MVQRVLAAKSVQVTKTGCLLAAFMKITAMGLIVLPGLFAAALFPDEVKADSNNAFFLLVTRVLPNGVRGVLVAGMIAAFICANASAFSSAASLLVNDAYLVHYPDATQEHQVWMGRAFTLGLAFLSLAWLPIVGKWDELFIYTQYMTVIWAAPIAVAFMAGFYTSVDAFPVKVSCFVNIGIGVAFVVAKVAFDALAWLNILHFSCISFVLSWGVIGLVWAVTNHRQEGDPETGKQPEQTDLAQPLLNTLPESALVKYGPWVHLTVTVACTVAVQAYAYGRMKA
jgi:uncharacterized sodium:solute symporter family permease YidK